MKATKSALSLFTILALSFVSYSQKTMSKKHKRSTIENIKELIHTNYVFEDRAATFTSSLDSLVLTKKYDDLTDYQIFADTLTADLVEITNDKHFKVQYNPGLVKARREWQNRPQAQDVEEDVDEPAEEPIDWDLWYAQKENFGFEKVEILAGNVGYIKLDFWQPLEWAKPTIDATMAFIANTDALIIDLTENQGGYGPTDSYLASYFFEESATLWMSSYERRRERSDSVFTFQTIGGKRYLEKPIFILVSQNTFSLAEQFAYALKHFNKAKIIGKPSAGAAHAIDFIEVNDYYLIQLPISRSIHPVTKTDWEGTGVIPNTITDSAEALKTAHLEALDQQIERLSRQKVVGPILKRYEKAREEISRN